MRAVRRVLPVLAAVLLVFGMAACSHNETPPAAPADVDIVMPNLVGMSWHEAQPALHEAGWTGTISRGPDIPGGPENHNRIITQQPGPGERVQADVDIKIQWGS